ncbi:MAG: efflux RND transporter permease subunit [Maricaulaceae bacterium]|nr:efflux RND transporter permease subunit [Maricaulaceae bacterium]
MTLSDIAVKRPVMAGVLSALLIVFGVLGFASLPVRELPNVDRPVVSVQTSYPGANAEVVENRVTQVIEEQLTGIDGVDLITSSSRDGRSNISITFHLERDIEAAANDVRDAVSRVIGRLPQDVDPPQVNKQDSDARPIIWYSLSSERLTMEELTDFAERYIVDRLAVIDGVATVRIGGQRRFAMRIWLDPSAMASRGVTIDDIERALRTQNVELPAGALETPGIDLTVRVQRGYADPEAFARLPVGAARGGHVVRLGEIADVEIGPAEPRSLFRGNGVTRIGLGIVRQSQANSLDVAREVREEVGRIAPTLPEGMEIMLANDSTIFIEESIREVWRTLAVAATLVVAVIFLFLGSLRAALIPAAVVPVCLIGTFAILAVLGFSINILTLLALVLCIGLVVDDSIVVLENIQRRTDEGEPRILAAFNGARQVFFAVIATTAVVVAVFVPLLFLPGFIGRIFIELAATVSGAVILSSIVALTLSPMMASKLIKPANKARGVTKLVDDVVGAARRQYCNSLEAVLKAPWLAIPFVLAAVGGSAFFMSKLPGELIPTEDRGGFFAMFSGPQGAGFEYTARQAEEIEQILFEYLESGELAQVMVVVPGWGGGGFSSGVVVGTMAHWNDRSRGAEEIIGEINTRFAQLTGVRAFASGRSALGGGGGDDIQFVLGGPEYEMLDEWADALIARAQQQNPNLLRMRKSYEANAPRLLVDIDRERAAALGVSVQSIGRALEAHMGSRRVGTFVDRGEEYDVMIQNRRAARASQEDLEMIQVRAESGALIPLSNLVSLREVGEAADRPRVNRLRAITVSATLADGYTLGEAVDWFDATARDMLPPEIRTEYLGAARDFLTANQAAIFAFALALLIVFLVLAAQFESLIQPFVIMLTVPLAIAGGLFGLYMAGSTLNIYSQIGLVVLIGLAAKNGILIVEFANQLRDQGLALKEATLKAAEIRFRPILMTGLSTAIGASPLMLATGPGAESRATIGVVIFAGVLTATLFTLFVVPAVYSVLGRWTKTPNWVARQLARQQRESGEPAPSPAE